MNKIFEAFFRFLVNWYTTVKVQYLSFGSFSPNFHFERTGHSAIIPCHFEIFPDV